MSQSQAPPIQTNSIPMFCSLHGKQLDFLCLDCSQRVCLDCLGTGGQHQGHRFDFLTSFLSGNQESLEFVKQNARLLHKLRRDVID